MGPFRAVWNCDFEFRQPDGERPSPVCLVARELHSRREVRVWRDELLRLRAAPFAVDETTLFVAYNVVAELSCFIVLGWRTPARIVDLYVEHLADVNGLKLPPKSNGLLAVMARHGLPVMSAAHKDAMRDKIITADHWDADDQAAILAYCAEDVDAAERLLRVMSAKGLIDWPRAVWRGEYMLGIAHMMHNGIPVDAALYRRFLDRREDMKRTLIQRVDGRYGVYVGDSFNRKKFAAWLAANRIPWPRLASGNLQLEQEVFKSQADAYPTLAPLRELTLTLAQIRSTGLVIGSDGRNRCSLWPFRSRTGRNQPSNTQHILGAAAWMRGLVTPPPGHGLAIIDWSAQEVAIAAGRSGDPGMCAAYASGDVHMAVAIAAGLAPPGATKVTHPVERERAKAMSLGMNYGASPYGVAKALGIPLAEGRELLEAHRAAYPVFWRWIGKTIDDAMLTSHMTAALGWSMRIAGEPNPRGIQNWTMQANGSEMLRAAVVYLIRAGLTLCASAHDAIMLQAPLDRLEADVALARSIMERVSLSFTRGLRVRTEAKIIRPGQRYLEARGERMWSLVNSLMMGDGSHGSDGSLGCDGSDWSHGEGGHIERRKIREGSQGRGSFRARGGAARMIAAGPLNWGQRIASYAAFARRAGFPAALSQVDGGWVYGVWIIGNDYRVATGYHGGYPPTYLRRLRALFPDKTRALHLFSGKVDLTAFPGDTVDINADLNPTFVDDGQTLESVPLERYDLVLADPPYSDEDAEHYGTSMVKRNRVMQALERLPSGAHVAWLDQMLPMYRKVAFVQEAVIGIQRSTNHRFRCVVVFRRQ